MKKLLISITGLALVLTAVNCKSVDKTKLGDKEVVTVTEMRPVIFTLWGAQTKDCLRSLDKEGATNVTSTRQGITAGNGMFVDIGSNGLFTSYRLSTSTETCQATGTK